MSLASDLGVSLFPTWHTGLTVDWHDGQRSTYSGQYPSYWTDADKTAAVNAVDTLTEMSETFELQTPWEAPHAFTWDFETLDSWLAANVNSSLARSLVKRGILILLC
jgi:hypothetical protein